MANRITAINAKRPKLKLGKTAGMAQVINYVAGRTGLNRGDLQLALSELAEAIKFYNLHGQGVKLEHLGTYLPTIDTKGKFNVSHRLDKSLSNTLNAPGAFQGEIINKANIGKSSQELINQWNKEHPDDPVVETAPAAPTAPK